MSAHLKRERERERRRTCISSLGEFVMSNKRGIRRRILDKISKLIVYL